MSPLLGGAKGAGQAEPDARALIARTACFMCELSGRPRSLKRGVGWRCLVHRCRDVLGEEKAGKKMVLEKT